LAEHALEVIENGCFHLGLRPVTEPAILESLGEKNMPYA
jgi:hypothetical protein